MLVATASSRPMTCGSGRRVGNVAVVVLNEPAVTLGAEGRGTDVGVAAAGGVGAMAGAGGAMGEGEGWEAGLWGALAWGAGVLWRQWRRPEAP